MKTKSRIDESRDMIRSALDMAYGSYVEQEGKKGDQWRDQSIGQIGDHIRHEINTEVMGNLRTGDFGFLLHNAMDVIELGAMLLAKAQDLMKTNNRNESK